MDRYCHRHQVHQVHQVRISAHCVDTTQASLCIAWAVGMVRVKESYDGTLADAVSTIATAEGGSTQQGTRAKPHPMFLSYAHIYPRRKIPRLPTAVRSNRNFPAIGLGTIACILPITQNSRAALSPQGGSCITARCRSGIAVE